ncbi:MAG: hypothetical protein CEO12_151 [Parcubacteria group bacterium Gr01-1014_46]|nr:MAG: hypothetical protein CEO12_151 [Parcubacteria group bacterium Gr01-1014_46]
MVKSEIVAWLREKAAEPGFFRACLGSETADAMANGTMDDETTLRTSYAFATAILSLS